MSISSRVLVINLLIYVAAYVAMVAERGTSPSYTFALYAGGGVLVLVAVATFSTSFRRGLFAAVDAVPSRPLVRAALAVVPWLALYILVALNGRWWTERAPALRFFVLYALANWSVVWIRRASARPNARRDEARRALYVVAAIFLALGIEGSAFGVNAFGAGLSALLSVAGALALAAAAFIRPRSSVLAVLTTVAATVAALALAEGAFRALHVGDAAAEVDVREHARQFYNLVPPGAAFVNRPRPIDEFDPVLIEINSKGLRGPEAPPGPADFLLIGDSFIEARQLPWEQTLGPRLDHALRARSSPARVVSHGTRGWSPLLEWNWYLKAGRQFKPRLVLLFFFWNDLWPAGREADTFRAVLTPEGRPAFFDVPVDPVWIWYKHARLARVTEEAWRRLGTAGLRRAFAGVTTGALSSEKLDTAAAQRLARSLADAPPLSPAEIQTLLDDREDALPPPLRQVLGTGFWPGLRRLDLWNDAQHRAAEETERELRRFAADVASDGGRLAIVYVPNPYQIHPSECSVGRLLERVDTGVVLPPDSGVQAWLRGAAGRAGIPLVDLTGPMREFDRLQPADSFEPLYLRADCHWSPRGHRFVADALADSPLVGRHANPRQ